MLNLQNRKPKKYCTYNPLYLVHSKATCYGGADKSLALPGRKQATATEDFEFHISYL